MSLIEGNIMPFKYNYRAGLTGHNISLFLPASGFLTGTLQNHARKYHQPIDHLFFKFNVLPHYRDQEAVTEAMAKLDYGQELEMDQVQS